MGKYLQHQTDGNERALVAYLEAHGVQVHKIGQPVDLLLAYQGVTAVAEVKTPRGKLRPSQKAFLEGWRGLWAVLKTEADCNALLGAMRAWASRVNATRGF